MASYGELWFLLGVKAVCISGGRSDATNYETAQTELLSLKPAFACDQGIYRTEGLILSVIAFS